MQPRIYIGIYTGYVNSSSGEFARILHIPPFIYLDPFLILYYYYYYYYYAVFNFGGESKATENR